MANFAAALIQPILTSTDGSIGLPEFRQPEAAFTVTLPFGVGNWVDVPDPLPPATQTAQGTAVIHELSAGKDWFERIHLLPRGGVDFGFILSPVDRRFELFNAFRQTRVLLNSVTDPGVGVTIPDLPGLPYSQEYLQSIIDPLTAGTLTPLGLIVRALRTGPPVFDANFLFTYDVDPGPGVTTVVMSLRVRGTRFTAFLFLPDGTGGYTETLEWLTDVLEAQDGTEQRISARKQPRQSLRLSYRLDGADRQQAQSVLLDRLADQLAVPFWAEQMRLTAAASPGAVTITVDSTTDVDVRAGGQVLIVALTAAGIPDRRTYDVKGITAIGATSITFDSGILETYAVGALVVPIRLCWIEQPVQGSRYPVNLETLSFLARVVDNDTGAPTASTAGWSTYGGKVLFDDCNLMDGENPESYSTRIDIVDEETGVRDQVSPWDRSRRTHRKGFLTQNRAQLYKLRRLLLALRGRQVSFWIPTFHEDVTVTQNLSSGTATMTIDNIQYSNLVRARSPANVLRVTLTNGTKIVRGIISAAELSETEERLTLDANWASTITPAEIVRVDFFAPARFDTDRFEIQHTTIPGVARVLTPVRTILEI